MATITSKGGAMKLTPSSDATQRLTVMQVAARLGKRYQKARDMMLARKFGDAVYVDNKLTVTVAGVEAWEAKQKDRPIMQKPEER